MFAKFSIRSKMIAVISSLLIALAGTGLLAINKMRAINLHTVDIATNWLPSIKALGDLRVTIQRYRVNLRQFVLETDPAPRAAIAKNLDAIVEEQARAFKVYEPLVTSPEERALYEELTRGWNTYLAAAREVLDAAGKENDHTKARDLIVNKTSPIARSSR